MHTLRIQIGLMLGALACLALLTGLLLVSGCAGGLVSAWERARCTLPPLPDIGYHARDTPTLVED